MKRTPIVRKRATPRTRRCVCGERTAEKKCATCGTRKTSGRKALGARLSKMWADLIRMSYADGDVARCRRCERRAIGVRIEAAHIIRRARSHNTRWHPRGGIPLCEGPLSGRCHYWYDNQASDEERAAFTIQVVGRVTYDELHRIKNEKWDKDLGAVLARLREAA